MLVRHQRARLGLISVLGGSDAYVSFGSKAAAQGTPACVCCQLRSGSSASGCPGLDVKPT